MAWWAHLEIQTFLIAEGREFPNHPDAQDIMEERYEVKSKIGQGGFGSVYRAYDKRMSRDVAIKRINTSDEDGMLKEAARQLSKEAGALASLQHPNIITVYDVGSDEDGPYVVMELLSGNSLDELIERAPLTWEDFRELAMQTQEALIGAQELELVHRDIKPANVMLSWLPSGKFQVKLVDFGLAKLTQRPSLQTLNQADSIFGSIFFMAPEQFEREPLDQRTDMYAIGCVYYYSLTGLHPFDGATAVQVMSAHLSHDFVPLNEARPDLPRWVCDWVMWHMNRYPDDRPASAREALQVFVQNDRNPPVEVAPTPAPAAGRPRLLIPGAEPLIPGEVAEKRITPPTGALNPKTKTAPQPLVPPTGSKPSVHTAQLEMAQNGPGTGTDQVEPVPVTPAPVEKPTPPPPAPITPDPAPAPPPVAESAAAEEPETKPEAAPVQQPKRNTQIQLKRPSVAPPFAGAQMQAKPVTGGQPAATESQQPTGLRTVGAQPGAPSKTGPIPTAPAGDAPTGEVVAAVAAPATAKKGLANSAKIAIAAVLAVLLILAAWMLMDRSAQNRENETYNKLVTLGAHPETTEVPMNRDGLDIMLRAAVSLKSNDERGAVYRTLMLASSTDGTNIDMEIVKFVTERAMIEDVRERLIGQVLGRRGNREIVTPLLDFSKETENETAAVAAMKAVRNLVAEPHFDRLLATVQFTESVHMRRAAEEAIIEILGDTTNPEKFAPKLHGIYQTSVNDDARHSALRLFGRIGDDASLEIVRDIMANGEMKDKIAALAALSAWGNGKGFPVLISFFNTTEDGQLRHRTFEAAMRYATGLDERGADEMLRQDVWTQLSLNARTSEEQERVVRGLAVNDRDDWVIPILQGFTRDSNPDKVIDVAERAIRSVNERRRSRTSEN